MIRPSEPPAILEIVCADAPSNRNNVPEPIARSVSVPPVVMSAVAPFWNATFPAFVTVKSPATETLSLRMIVPVPFATTVKSSLVPVVISVATLLKVKVPAAVTVSLSTMVPEPFAVTVRFWLACVVMSAV